MRADKNTGLSYPPQPANRVTQVRYPSQPSLPSEGWGLGVRTDHLYAESPIPQSRKGETRLRRKNTGLSPTSLRLSTLSIASDREGTIGVDLSLSIRRMERVTARSAGRERLVFGTLRIALVLFIASLLPSCQNHTQTNATSPKPCVKTATLPVKYAKGFTVDYYDGFKVITIHDLKDSGKTLAQYVLLPANKPAPVGFENAEMITTPVRKTVCVSTTTIGEMSLLNLLDSIAAVTDVELIYNQQVTEKLKTNQIADAGRQEVNYEKLVELHPAFVFTSGGYDGGDKLQLKLNSLHIHSVLDLEYKEQAPLGRAEWIKFIAAFYDRESLADSLFSNIEKRYLYLKDLAATEKQKPTVFCNLPFKEIWYMPCGENYIARLIDDAGGRFLWKEASSTNGLNLNLDYEAVYNKAAAADYWINAGFAASLHDIQSADKKNTLFKAFRTGKVYSNNKRNTPGGGFDFWESGTVRPDEILADLITIFHPGLLKDHELYYYQKLK